MGTCIYTSFWKWTKEILEVGWPSHTVVARTLPILAIYLYKTDWNQLTRNFTRNCIVCCFDIVLKVSVKPLDLLNELVCIFSDTHLVTVFLKHILSNNLYLLWWYEEVPRLCYCWFLWIGNTILHLDPKIVPTGVSCLWTHLFKLLCLLIVVESYMYVKISYHS